MIYKKINQLFNRLYNGFLSLIYCHKIVVVIGDQNLLIIIYYNDIIQQHLLLTNQHINYNNTNLQQLITKYSRAKVYLILDNTEISIQYINLTSFESLINRNIVARFARQEFQDNELYAHKLLSYDLNNQAQILFFLSNISKIQEFWLDNIFNKQILRFGGVYFLPLEISHIMQKFSKICLNTEQQTEFNIADIQIFSFISQVSGIRTIVLQNRRILLNNYVKYPHEKSLQYIRGTIEQELNEVILNSSHIADHSTELTTSLVFLATAEVTETLQTTKFNNIDSQIIINIATLDILPGQSTQANHEPSKHFFDLFLNDLIFRNCTFAAVNNNLSILLSLQKLNYFATKIFLYVTLFLVITVVYVKICTLKHEHDITKISEQYFKNNLEYNQIKATATNIKYFDQIAELLFLQNSLSSKQILPINFLKDFLHLQNSNIAVTSFHWYKPDFTINNDKFIAEININYLSHVDNSSKDNLLSEVDKYIKLLQANFKAYNITYQCNLNNLRLHMQETTLPVMLIISN